ncbi:MAG: hypothetical protein EZS28_038613, partial [Streblomastix strix]
TMNFEQETPFEIFDFTNVTPFEELVYAIEKELQKLSNNFEIEKNIVASTKLIDIKTKIGNIRIRYVNKRDRTLNLENGFPSTLLDISDCTDLDVEDEIERWYGVSTYIIVYSERKSDGLEPLSILNAVSLALSNCRYCIPTFVSFTPFNKLEEQQAGNLGFVCLGTWMSNFGFFVKFQSERISLPFKVDPQRPFILINIFTDFRIISFKNSIVEH